VVRRSERDTPAVLVVRDAGGVVEERRVDWYDISSVTDPQ
jgi:hypothetical protein